MTTTRAFAFLLPITVSSYETFTDKFLLQQSVEHVVNRITDNETLAAILDRFGPMKTWDVSGVGILSYALDGLGSFNADISGWNTTGVTSMRGMFNGCLLFNQSLERWDVASVTDMESMFSDAGAFNQPLNDWDVSNVASMGNMFFNAKNFNQPLDSWDVSSVTDMEYMFRDASAFNQPLEGWDVSSVTSMDDMFSNAPRFNQPLGYWNVSSVLHMGEMFAGAVAFNQNLCPWRAVMNWDNEISMETMFVGSGCPRQKTPIEESNYFCARDCSTLECKEEEHQRKTNTRYILFFLVGAFAGVVGSYLASRVGRVLGSNHRYTTIVPGSDVLRSDTSAEGATMRDQDDARVRDLELT